MRKLFHAREGQLIVTICVMVLLISLRAPVFLSGGSLDTVLTDSAILAMMATAQMLAVMTRGIDISVAAVIALTGMATALLSRAFPGMPVAETLAVAVGLGLILGSINGSLIAYVGIPPLVVTLGTMSIFRGSVFFLSGGQWVNAQDFAPQFLAFPIGRLFGVTHIVWIAAFVLLCLQIFLVYFRKGRELYALGGNPTAARYVGINEKANLMMVYCIIGVIGGLCGYLWVARYAIAYTEVAMGFEMQTVAACVIGGVSMAGGTGRVAGCLLGSIFLVIILNALPIINVSPFWQMAISGLVILAAVLLNIGGGTKTKLILKSAQLGVARVTS